MGLFLIISQLIDNKFNIFFFIIGLACYILGVITLFMVNKNLFGLLSVIQVLAILIALFINDELSSQKRQLMKENFIGRFPLETFSRSRIYKK